VTLDDRVLAALDRASADVRAAAQAEVDEVRHAAELTAAALRASSVRLGDCIHAIDDAPSLHSVLTVVAGCARLEAGRAAVLLVNDGTCSAYPSRTAVPSDQARLAASVAQEGIPVIDSETAAFPIAVGGHVVAVLSTAAPISPEAQTALDLLVRHAGRVLEAMTVRQITGLTPLAEAVSDVPGESAS
jgi:hypothetical protein